MLKKILLVIVLSLLLPPVAQAYNPPPAITNLLKHNSVCVPPDIGCPVNPPPPPLGPLIRIQLPPRLIATPDKLLFPDFAGQNVIFNFVEDENDLDNSHFVRQSGEGYEKYGVTTSVEKINTAGAYYVVTVYGFERDQAPRVKDLRLTFKPAVPKANIEAVENYLKSNSVPTAQLTGPGCVGGTDSHLCLDTITTVRAPSTRLFDAHLRQTLAVRGTFVPGNVAAPGEISGFSLGTSSLAVGGTITVDGGTKLQQYLNDQTVTFGWDNVGGKINDLFSQGITLGSNVNSPGNFNGRHYTANSWNFNAPLLNPADGSSTSFSSPPEGKIWKVTATESDFTIGNGSTPINISGAGTLVVVGDEGQDVNLIFNGPVTCTSGARVSFMTKGNIIFQALPSDDYRIEVGCGAYTSLNGDIDFAPGNVKSGQLSGIFVAKKNILLPNSDGLTSAFIIKRDDVLATNPTSLLRDVLRLIFLPS